MENYYQSESKSIKNWKEDDRPREKMLQKGTRALSDAELIAILLGSGNRQESAVGLAKRMLEQANQSISALAKYSIEDLQQFKGVGIAKAIGITAALELGKRLRLEKAEELPTIRSSKDVFEIMQPIIGDLNYEEFWVIYLNRSNKPIHKMQISKGGITGTIVDLRIIFKKALQLLSTNIILVHNHPSGNLKPSQADISITKKILKAGKIMDIQLYDHLIVTEKTYYSFANEGVLHE